MKKRYLLIACFLTLQFTITYAQPHIEGTLKINASKGILEANFVVKHLPVIGNYRILLNKGLNIKYFGDTTGKPTFYHGFYDGKNRGEATEYLLSSNGDDTIKAINGFSVGYTGAFPVYTKEFSLFDFKGLIACNGKTLRATEQSKWYPVLYDVAKDRLIDAYTYNITVEAADTKTVFINGSVPQYTQLKPLVFSSIVPRQLLLFAGNYLFLQQNGSYLLNTTANKETASKIFNELDKIKQFLAQQLNSKYTQPVFIISHEAVKKMKPESSWGFTVFPSFAYAGLNFATLVNKDGHFDDGNTAFFVHELAHAYFGSNTLSGKIYWFWLESTTEYLSLKALQHLASTKEFNRVMTNYKNLTLRSSFKPLSEIEQPESIDDDYRYVYGPLLWFCFEQQFGEAVTMKTLKNVLDISYTETLTIESWKKAAVKAGVTEAQFLYFTTKYLIEDKTRKVLGATIDDYLGQFNKANK